MISMIFKKEILELLVIFSLAPGAKFSRNELKEKTKLNNVNLDNAIAASLSSNLIKKEKRGLSLNLENAGEIIRIIGEDYARLNKLPLDAYFSIIELMSYLTRLKGIEAFLFGSYSKLVFNEKSDIDIAVVSDKIKSEHKKELNKIIHKIKHRYSKEIELHYFAQNLYKNRRDPLVAEILKNGIRLI